MKSKQKTPILTHPNGCPFTNDEIHALKRLLHEMEDYVNQNAPADTSQSQE